jgi:hypothetical protein
MGAKTRDPPLGMPQFVHRPVEKHPTKPLFLKGLFNIPTNTKPVLTDPNVQKS